ncbi:MAG: hypothetical protein ACYDG3_10085, partial [Bacillati bacterium]
HSLLKDYDLHIPEMEDALISADELRQSILECSTDDVDGLLHILKDVLNFREYPSVLEISAELDNAVELLIAATYVKMNQTPPVVTG